LAGNLQLGIGSPAVTQNGIHAQSQLMCDVLRAQSQHDVRTNLDLPARQTRSAESQPSAIPIELIRARIDKDGFGSALGA